MMLSHVKIFFPYLCFSQLQHPVFSEEANSVQYNGITYKKVQGSEQCAVIRERSCINQESLPSSFVMV